VIEGGGCMELYKILMLAVFAAFVIGCVVLIAKSGKFTSDQNKAKDTKKN
jgi:hypothetical protein